MDSENAQIYFELGRVAAKEVVGAVVRKFAESRLGGTKEDRRKYGAAIDRLVREVNEGALEMHLRDGYGWAERFQVHGMPQPAATDGSSIPLEFDPVLREFRGLNRSNAVFGEHEFLTSSDSFIILGDPGSGKTTTLKRLVLSSFESLDGASEHGVSLPLLIVCREVDWESTCMYSEVLSRMGVNLATVRTTLGDSEATMMALTASLLDALPAVLFIDGIDEIPGADAKRKTVQAVARLGRTLGAGRMVCTCRLGESFHFEGLQTAELLPLSSEQIASLVALQTVSGDSLLRALEETGRSDILDRPLLLNQILTVYATTGSLPDRPVDLHRSLLRLLIHEWDEQRGISRASAYSGFDSASKQDFLSEIAFALTIRGKAVFSEADLLDIYGDIGPKFSLPLNSARKVIREIESHAGIVATIRDGFQFTHYTLQEHLCAENIVRRIITEEVANYLRLYPSIVAIAVALSSSPNEWLHECVAKSRRFESYGQVDGFAARLGLERPRFTTSPMLGAALLHLMSQAASPDLAAWDRLSKLPAVAESVELAGETLFMFREHRGKIAFARRAESDPDSAKRIPDGQIDPKLFAKFHDLEI